MRFAKCQKHPSDKPQDNIGMVRSAREFSRKVTKTYMFCSTVRKYDENADTCSKFKQA